VTRAVNAENIHEAGGTAIRLLQEEPKFQRMSAVYGGQAPELTIDEVVGSDSLELEATNMSGYVFYEEDV
jgi:hypothetical protein